MSSSLDYLDLCRLCLVKDRVSVPIFEDEGDVRQMFLKITACLPVKIAREDKLPKKICDDCVYKVELLYQFWNTTANAEKQLLQWLGEVGGLEDKQGYVTEVLDSSAMKQEQPSDNRLDGSIMQVRGHQNNMEMGMMNNMTLITMPTGSEQFTSVPMDTTGTVQTIPSGSSTQVTHDQIVQNQTAVGHMAEEESEEEDNSDEGCDNEEGLPVKEEAEEDPNDQSLEQTAFVNVPISCGEAGPSGLQQQKISEMSEMAMQPSNDVDPKSGFNLPERFYPQTVLVTVNDDKTNSIVQLDDSEPNSPIITKKKRQMKTLKTEPVVIKVEENENDKFDPEDLPLANFCGPCKLIFASEELLDSHKSTQHKSSKYQCAQCGKSCPTSCSLRQHLKRHRKTANGPGKISRLYRSSKEEREIVCKTCGKVFRHKSNYHKHQVRHRAGELICKHCPKKFRLYRDLARHEKTHFHPSYACKECDYETTVMSALTTHMLRHSEKTELPFDCNECDKRFRKATELQEHYNLHSGEKPFTCQACPSAFYLRRQLSAHCRRHHPELKAQKVTSTACDICGRVLATKRSLFRHKESHNPTKLYLCDYCGKSLSSAEHLKKHRRIHTGEKPYVCDICGKGFTDSENLRMHRRIHTGEKPYKCDQCPKAFSQRSTLTIHKRGHTGEKPYVCHICQRGFSCQGNLTAHQKSTCV